MTTNTTSGAADLLDLIEAYAEARHRQGHSSYNAQTAAALQAVKAALAAGQATAAQPDDVGRKSIDMVLHCPKCGLQHIDEDNSEDLRIEAAELGVDREGDRELERWIEEREWTNQPHRSHLCASCKHFKRRSASHSLNMCPSHNSCCIILLTSATKD